MNRRGFLTFLGLAPAIPLVAALALPASGGTVSPGRTFMVGERGLETLVRIDVTQSQAFDVAVRRAVREAMAPDFARR